jgi:NAD(P)-dependent dehydrogenase (short-subunit alcohol dehydrogenase family)
MDRLDELNRALGGGHFCIAADVSRIDDCRSLVEQAIARHGRIDTLVCNAGYGIYKWISRTTPQDTRDIFATNVLGTTDCIHFALPHMMRQEQRDGWRGQIMIVSSVVGRRGMPFIGMYSATKAAQFALSDALRVELRPQRIAVTSVHPTQTATEFGKVASTWPGEWRGRWSVRRRRSGLHGLRAGRLESACSCRGSSTRRRRYFAGKWNGRIRIRRKFKSVFHPAPYCPSPEGPGFCRSSLFLGISRVTALLARRAEDRLELIAA